MSKRVVAYKIVDTIQNFGAAEEYINLDADFQRFIKQTYGKFDILNVDAKKIVEQYNLKGIVFGNYVSQEERYHFLYKISKQLEVIAKITKRKNLGKGKLIIAFGAEGKARALAHYNADKQLINLSRGRKGDYTQVLKGENSFIHEFGHFVDYETGRADKSIPFNFSSEVEDDLGFTGNDKTKNISGAVYAINQDAKYIEGLYKYSNAQYLASNVELWARLFETALSYYIYDNYKSYRAFIDVNKYGKDIYLKKEKLQKAKGFNKAVISAIKNF